MTTTPAHTRPTRPTAAADPGTTSPGRTQEQGAHLGGGATVLSWATAALGLGAAGAGLVVDEVYAGDPATAAMLRGYDLVMLVVALPLLVLGLLAARRGSLLGLALTSSLLAYTAYTYAYYAFGTGFNDLFLVHVATLACAAVALLLVLLGIDADRFRRAGSGHVPARTVAALLGLLTVSLGGLWLYHGVANVVSGEVPVGSSLVETDLVVHLGMALDLAVLVPMYGAAALLVWRRTGWGFVLAAMAAVAGVLHQLSYVVALPMQVAADVPGAVAVDPAEPGIVAVYLVVLVLVLRGLSRGDRLAGRAG